MKKTMSVFLAMILFMLPMFALAADSPKNKTIPKTHVTEVEPEDETEDVVPPSVEIIEDTEEIIELRDEMKTIYTLTIYYIYADGTRAAPTYTAVLEAGTEYNVSSPAIQGYTTSRPVVSGVMPARNVQVTVVYTAPEDAGAESPAFPVSQMNAMYAIEDFETALGLGFSMCNVGICIE